MEKTLSIIKPDAVERNLIGQIVSIFEKNSLIIVALFYYLLGILKKKLQKNYVLMDIQDLSLSHFQM